MNLSVALNLELIITIVDGGKGPDVVDFSKEAGASGGTILHGRGSGIHDAGKFLGLEIEPEKDIVLTIVPDSLTTKVMNAIGEGIQINKPGNGVALSIALSKVIGINQISQFSQVVDMDELLDDSKL